MLRAFVALLVLANVVFWAWSQGWLDGIVGVKARGDREPERLALQLHPELVVVLPKMPAAATAPSCVESGPYAPTEVAAAEAALRSAVPGVAWTNARTEQPGQWVVYMGGYPDRDTMKRKEDEISRVGVRFDEQALPGDGPFGLVLGRYDDRAAADRALAQVQQRGVRTARVVVASLPAITHMLRVERAEPAQFAQLLALKNDALGKGFAACTRSEAAR
jgi:hypothetical protein